MNKKDLTDLGIAEDVADKIIVLHGKGIEASKAEAATAKTEAEGFKKQLAEAGTTIEGFKKLDVAGIQKAADEYKAQAEKAQADAAAQIASLKFDHALEGALAGAKVKNVKAVKALLDLGGLKLGDDGAIVGADETKSLKAQLERVQKESDYLFENETPELKIVAGGNNRSIVGDAVTDAMRRGAGLPVGK